MGKKKLTDDWKRIPDTPEALAEAVLSVDAKAVRERIREEESKEQPKGGAR